MNLKKEKVGWFFSDSATQQLFQKYFFSLIKDEVKQPNQLDQKSTKE
jgi:hypothetical protein